MRSYYIRSASFIGSVWLIVLFSITFTASTHMFFHFGPSSNIRFFIFSIDTWGKWFGVIAYSFVSQSIASFMSASIGSYVRNVIRDHKSI